MTISRVRRYAIGIAAAFTLSLALTACLHGKSSGGGGSDNPTGSSSSAAAAGGAAKSAVTVDVKNFAFNPGTATVKVGGKVTWKFEDSTGHTVNAGGKTSPTLSNGKTYSYTFKKAGTYNYICTIHQYMTGKIVVKK
jgi:plastocyanin